MSHMGGLFDSTGFPPRWKCGNWPPELGWTHIAADLAIFTAYLVIPVAVAVLVIRRRRLPFAAVFWLFSAFILSCGAVHLLDAVAFYRPMYRLSGLVKVMTAAASWVALVALLRIIPRALRLGDIQSANQELSAEVQERTKAQESLERARHELERRSSELTLNAHRLRQAMNATWVIACRWVAETGVVLWEIGGHRWMMDARASNGTALKSWADVLPEDEVARFTAACREAVRLNAPMDFEAVVRATDGSIHRFRLSASPDDPVAGEPRTMTGMARLI